MQQADYHICFMDICMPVMDGVTLIKLINENTTVETPIFVVVAACLTELQKQECLNTGIEYFITKPILKHILETVMDKIIFNLNIL